MSTPIIAGGRISTPYTISGRTHVHHAYVRNPQLVSGFYKINTRTLDANDLLVSDAAEAMADVLSVLGPTGITFGTQTFETYAAGVWTPRETHTPTVTPTGGAVNLASQVTLVLRDLNFKKVKVVFLEGIEVPPQRWTVPTGGDAAMDLFVSHFLPSPPIANSPYNWMVGRGNAFLNTAPYVAVNVWLNTKVGAARGL